MACMEIIENTLEIVTTATSDTLLAQLSCDQVRSDVQWLLSFI